MPNSSPGLDHVDIHLLTVGGELGDLEAAMQQHKKGFGFGLLFENRLSCSIEAACRSLQDPIEFTLAKAHKQGSARRAARSGEWANTAHLGWALAVRYPVPARCSRLRWGAGRAYPFALGGKQRTGRQSTELSCSSCDLAVGSKEAKKYSEIGLVELRST